VNGPPLDIFARLTFLSEMQKSGIFTASALAVAFRLLHHHYNADTGQCDPSTKRVAKDTNLSIRSVKYAVDEFEESGWWRIGRGQGTMGNGGRTNTYEPLIEVAQRWCNEGGAKVVQTNEGGAILRHEVVQSIAPEPVKEPVREESSLRSDSVHPGRGGAIDQSRRTKRMTKLIDGWDPKDIDEMFEEFWQAIPARSGPNPKKPAKTAFIAAVRNGTHPQDIIEAAGYWAMGVFQLKSDPKFIPQAVTWLRQERWEEELDFETEERELADIIVENPNHPLFGQSIDHICAELRRERLAARKRGEFLVEFVANRRDKETAELKADEDG
jgi:hypothetical protein